MIDDSNVDIVTWKDTVGVFTQSFLEANKSPVEPPRYDLDRIKIYSTPPFPLINWERRKQERKEREKLQMQIEEEQRRADDEDDFYLGDIMSLYASKSLTGTTDSLVSKESSNLSDDTHLMKKKLRSKDKDAIAESLINGDITYKEAISNYNLTYSQATNYKQVFKTRGKNMETVGRPKKVDDISDEAIINKISSSNFRNALDLKKKVTDIIRNEMICSHQRLNPKCGHDIVTSKIVSNRTIKTYLNFYIKKLNVTLH